MRISPLHHSLEHFPANHSLVPFNAVDVANAIEPPIFSNLPKGSPGATKNAKKYDLAYDVSKADRILGLKYTSTEKMLKDSLEAFKELEHE